MCDLQMARRAGQGNFETQTMLASVDILGLSCRHARPYSSPDCLNITATTPYPAAMPCLTLSTLHLPSSSRIDALHTYKQLSPMVFGKGSLP